MSNQDYPDPAEGWAIVCQEFPKLRQRATGAGRRDRVERLRAQGRTDQALRGWLDLREDLRRLDRDEADHTREWMVSLSEALSQTMGRPSSQEPGFVCPEKICPRRAVLVAGEPPYCELSGVQMDPER